MGHKILVELNQEDEQELRAYAERYKISLYLAAQVLLKIVLGDLREKRATECWEGVIKEPRAWALPDKGELPPSDDRVLCCTQTKSGQKNIVIGYYMDGMWRCGMNSSVVAWQPLPEPPEVEE